MKIDCNGVYKEYWIICSQPCTEHLYLVNLLQHEIFVGHPAARVVSTMPIKQLAVCVVWYSRRIHLFCAFCIIRDQQMKAAQVKYEEDDNLIDDFLDDLAEDDVDSDYKPWVTYDVIVYTSITISILWILAILT